MPGPAGPGESLFATRWVHAFEEDTAEGEVYRPETDEVPLSRRPRRRLSFSPDGSARVSLPGPDDRPVETSGAWRQEGDDLVVRFAAEAGRAAQTLRISVQSPTRLIVRK